MKLIDHNKSDIIAIVVLILLWLLFFWRLFTPVDVDRVAVVSGDFSGQFVAFGQYQYDRFSAGEVPLWNPYNNGGLPFIADTQAAVFYPPRLVTIAASSVSGGWGYNSLQMEMTFHILLYTLFMYVFVRRMTIGNGHASVVGAFISAIIAGYGGFMTGYPPLQLALLEAAIWLPLALVGILEATREANVRWRWLLISGAALGLSWMAGHPQTSWFSTYLLVAYFAYRVYANGYGWRNFVGGTILVGVITLGVTAVQFIPSMEYLGHTTRAEMGFDAKGNGFPVQDLIQFVFPSVMTIWSPLYFGVAGLILAVVALFGDRRERIFWGVVTIVALGLSLGKNGAVFYAFYNILPGLGLFRGQERAAFLVANSAAILAGLGVVTLYNRRDDEIFLQRIQRGLMAFLVACGAIASMVFVSWLGNPDSYSQEIGAVFFSTMIVAISLIIIPQVAKDGKKLCLLLLATVVVFELFSVNIDNDNYETLSADEGVVPPLFERVYEDGEIPYRVDIGIGGQTEYGYGNLGTLYGLQDIRGVSPLFLDGPHAIIYHEMPSEVAWELFAVKYVFTGWETIPAEGELIARDYPNENTFNLHRLDDPRPFALLMTDYVLAEDNQSARWLIAAPDFDERMTIVLDGNPGMELPDSLPDDAASTLANFAPESFTVYTNSSTNAILSVSLVDYPGWKVEIDGESVDTLRAYGALTAVPIVAGEHTVTFTYAPMSFKLGAILSLLTWLGLGVTAIVLVVRRKRDYANN